MTELPPPRFRVLPDNLQSPEVHALLREHMAGMMAHSPPESVHALPLDKLRHPSVQFWAVWQGPLHAPILCGCGALKRLDAHAGEIKSMRTRPAFLRQGVAQAVLDEIDATARQQGLQTLWLETGTGPDFEAAHRLYLRNGFAVCGPFGDYQVDPFSCFMVKRLSS
jgi:putative acetyltransferase